MHPTCPNAGGTALRKRAARGALLGAVLAGAGCIASPGGGGGGADFTGGWVWGQGACRQMLAFDGNGTFSFGVELALPEGTLREAFQGGYAREGGDEASHALELDPDVAIKSSDIAYCAQWARRTETLLPLDAASADLGLEVRTLAYRAEVSPALGPVLIGSAVDRSDRFALFRRGNSLSAARLDGTAFHPAPLYAALPGDPSREPLLISPYLVANLPESLYTESFAVSESIELRRIVLNVTVAADVTFLLHSPTSPPPCQLVAYTDLNWNFPIEPPLLQPTSPEQKISLDPADAEPLYAYDFTTAEGTFTSYLLPLSIFGTASGQCTVTVRALSAATAVLEAIVADPGYAPLFEFPWIGAGAFVVGAAKGHGEGLRRARWEPGLLARGMGLLPERLGTVPLLARDGAGEAPFFDLLDLLEPDPGPHQVSVGEWEGEPYLNLYGQGDAGLGPFLPIGAPDQASAVNFPATLTADFASAGAARTFRFEIAQERRVALWSEGPLDTYATLQDAQGWLLGGDDDGVAVGAGFRIVRTLAAGRYDLRVTARDAPGTATLHIESAGTAPVPDEALEACLIANGLERAAPGALTALACVGQGIASLEGLAATGEYVLLELAGNRLTSVAPLAALTRLRVLSLSDNALLQVGALGGLPLLHTLALAHNHLEPGALAALAPLAGTLRLLDLTGVESVPEEEVAALKVALPHTIIVTPSGVVLP